MQAKRKKRGGALGCGQSSVQNEGGWDLGGWRPMRAARGRSDLGVLPLESLGAVGPRRCRRTREENAEAAMFSGRAPHVVRSRREWHCALAAPVVLESPQRRRSCIAADCSCGGGDTARVAVRGERAAEQAKKAAEVKACEIAAGVCGGGSGDVCSGKRSRKQVGLLIRRNTLRTFGSRPWPVEAGRRRRSEGRPGRGLHSRKGSPWWCLLS